MVVSCALDFMCQFLIFNVCMERSYDEAYFNGRVEVSPAPTAFWPPAIASTLAPAPRSSPAQPQPQAARALSRTEEHLLLKT